MDERLKTTLGDWVLDNPVMPASGTFGFGYEFAQFYDLDILGSMALKGTTKEARFGNPTPRIAECDEGMINSVGLQNPGIDHVIFDELPKLKEVFHKKAIANIGGFSIEEYAEVARKFDRQDQIALLEVNVSCPNVSHGGMSFGTDPECLKQVITAVKAVTHKPVYAKLTPNVTDIAVMAKAAEEAGADGISLINTLVGSRFDLKTGRPIIANVMGGFSGPAVKPVALRMVYQVYEAVHLPIIGIGGIRSAEDVIEFMSAGASAIEIGAQNCVDPYACMKVIEGLIPLMDQLGIDKISEVIGRSHNK